MCGDYSIYRIVDGFQEKASVVIIQGGKEFDLRSIGKVQSWKGVDLINHAMLISLA